MAQAPAIIPNLPELVQRYANGESSQDLADEAKVNRTTLYLHMLTERGDSAPSLVSDCLANRIEEADRALARSHDMASVARAAHQARFARMDFERRRPALYGPKQELSVDKKVSVHIHREAPKPLPVDVKPVVQAELTVIPESVDTQRRMNTDDNAH